MRGSGPSALLLMASANRDALHPDDVEDLYDDILHAIAALGFAYGLEKP